MHIKSAIAALIISCAASPALAVVHAGNTPYYLGVNAPSDMPLPKTSAPGPGYVWGCRTDDNGQWKKNILGGYACDYYLNPLGSPTVAAPAPVQATPVVQTLGCNLQALKRTLPDTLVPTDSTGKQHPDFQLEECNRTTHECTWRNLNIAVLAPQETCTDPKVPIFYDGLCISKKEWRRIHSPYGAAFGVAYTGGYYGYGSYYGGSNYAYYPSSRQAPSACSSNGEYHRNGGSRAGRC